jgi:hypothetical protein
MRETEVRRCSGCQKGIFFAVTMSGKRAPIDPVPVADGNVIIEPPSDPRLPLTAIMLTKDAGPDQRRRAVWKSHYATCAEATMFRTPKAVRKEKT